MEKNDLVERMGRRKINIGQELVSYSGCDEQRETHSDMRSPNSKKECSCEESHFQKSTEKLSNNEHEPTQQQHEAPKDEDNVDGKNELKQKQYEEDKLQTQYKLKEQVPTQQVKIVASGEEESDEDEEEEEDGEQEIQENEPKTKIQEVCPNDRFQRYNEELGRGAYKIVYRAVDTEAGREVAWNVVNLRRLSKCDRLRIRQEIDLIKKLQHNNIIHFISAWINKSKDQVIFITELITGGTLRKYVKKVQNIKLKVIKRWCKEILEGLIYLHEQKPHPIIHRDLKCDNIFINSSTGEIRIGDLGLSTPMAQSYSTSVLGTPEFMAPELYEECYTTGVDIYAFGMCVLEMVTLERPYKECSNPAQIYKKVIGGVKPEALDRIEDQEIKDFILLCLSQSDKRPTARDLYNSKFLQDLESENNMKCIKVTHSTKPRARRLSIMKPSIIEEVAEEEQSDDNTSKVAKSRMQKKEQQEQKKQSMEKQQKQEEVEKHEEEEVKDVQGGGREGGVVTSSSSSDSSEEVHSDDKKKADTGDKEVEQVQQQQQQQEGENEKEEMVEGEEQDKQKEEVVEQNFNGQYDNQQELSKSESEDQEEEKDRQMKRSSTQRKILKKKKKFQKLDESFNFLRKIDKEKHKKLRRQSEISVLQGNNFGNVLEDLKKQESLDKKNPNSMLFQKKQFKEDQPMIHNQRSFHNKPSIEIIKPIEQASISPISGSAADMKKKGSNNNLIERKGSINQKSTFQQKAASSGSQIKYGNPVLHQKESKEFQDSTEEHNEIDRDSEVEKITIESNLSKQQQIEEQKMSQNKKFGQPPINTKPSTTKHEVRTVSTKVGGTAQQDPKSKVKSQQPTIKEQQPQQNQSQTISKQQQQPQQQQQQIKKQLEDAEEQKFVKQGSLKKEISGEHNLVMPTQVSDQQYNSLKHQQPQNMKEKTASLHQNEQQLLEENIGKNIQLGIIPIKFKLSKEGQDQEVAFPFNTEKDTALGVANEMVQDLELPVQKINYIAKLINQQVQAYKIKIVQTQLLQQQQQSSPNIVINQPPSNPNTAVAIVSGDGGGVNQHHAPPQIQPQMVPPQQQKKESPMKLTKEQAVTKYRECVQGIDKLQQFLSQGYTIDEFLEALDITDEDKQLKYDFLQDLFNLRSSYLLKIDDLKKRMKQKQQKEQSQTSSTGLSASTHQQQVPYQHSEQRQQQHQQQQQHQFGGNMLAPPKTDSHHGQQLAQGSGVGGGQQQKRNSQHPSTFQQEQQKQDHNSYVRTHHIPSKPHLPLYQGNLNQSEEEVKVLQNMLNVIYYVYKLQQDPNYLENHTFHFLKLDGFFDERTKNIVMKFQESADMQVDGIVNEHLWKKLVHAYEKIVSKEDHQQWKTSNPGSHHHHHHHHIKSQSSNVSKQEKGGNVGTVQQHNQNYNNPHINKNQEYKIAHQKSMHDMEQEYNDQDPHQLLPEQANMKREHSPYYQHFHNYVVSTEQHQQQEIESLQLSSRRSGQLYKGHQGIREGHENDLSQQDPSSYEYQNYRSSPHYQQHHQQHHPQQQQQRQVVSPIRLPDQHNSHPHTNNSNNLGNDFGFVQSMIH